MRADARHVRRIRRIERLRAMQESLHRSAQWNYLSRASRQARRERREALPRWLRIRQFPIGYLVDMVPEDMVPDVEVRRRMWQRAGLL